MQELRERVLVAALAAAVAVGTCFCFSKDLVVFLEVCWHSCQAFSAQTDCVL